MTQEEIVKKLAEHELCIEMQTEALRVLTKTVANLQESLSLLVDKLTQKVRKFAGEPEK